MIDVICRRGNIFVHYSIIDTYREAGNWNQGDSISIGWIWTFSQWISLFNIGVNLSSNLRWNNLYQLTSLLLIKFIIYIYHIHRFLRGIDFVMWQIILTDINRFIVEDAAHMPSVQFITVSLDPMQNDSSIRILRVIEYVAKVDVRSLPATSPTSYVKYMLE